MRGSRSQHAGTSRTPECRVKAENWGATGSASADRNSGLAPIHRIRRCQRVASVREPISTNLDTGGQRHPSECQDQAVTRP